MRNIDLTPKNGPYAASAYIVSRQGYVLAVSRKNNKKDFGLPGGKVDPGENFFEACVRETKEETGLNIWHGKPVFGGYCGNPKHHVVHWNIVYICKASGRINIANPLKETGKVIWTHQYRLIEDVDGELCSFSDFNKDFFVYLQTANIEPFLSDVEICDNEIEI